ncbi:FG-GAP repeat protein [Symmachiella macrocystis]|uniref:FG-GAP repeat protein n=1 Tax=Symmachiella macrocystis TaxID=2527985 RepID=A0A5C6BRB9_9PLAN|nr:VCBS repeat-containing protein [Symmachiella macrocystis]TWU14588.1 FG-GAP repeat protein [Symmachiella macrocystis]
MTRCRLIFSLAICFAALNTAAATASAEELQRLSYNDPDLVVDLGVGLWAFPLPMDYDGDGDHDLVVSCPDKPYNGTYFFENTSGDVAMPVFKPGVRLGPGHHHMQVSYVDGEPRVLRPAMEYQNFRQSQLSDEKQLQLSAKVYKPKGRIRANQWKYLDYNGDGALDIIVGVGDWTDYGWDDAYNEKGEWTRGPLRGFVFVIANSATTEEPVYAEPKRIEIDGAPLEVFGWPSPNFVDYDNDGDLDLLCGEFRDSFTYFENVGTRTEPKYSAGKTLMHGGKKLTMDLEMITPTAFDWDKDGDFDLICGDEDGRVAFLENTGKLIDGVPEFLPPRYFQQQAQNVKFGALSTPYGVDWDGDGDEDVICGNTAGYIGFIENLGGEGTATKWAAPVRMQADGETIRIQAGPNGSIQGPCESKWGYTTLSVADWDGDELPDIMINSIWGEILWYRNIGTRTAPQLAAAQPVEVQWPGETPKPAWTWWNPRGKQLVTQWRTTPEMVDWNDDGLMDLVMLDHEGYLAFFQRKKNGEQLQLLPGARVFTDEKGKLLRLNERSAGGSGRRKIHLVDVDGDGRRDMLMNSTNADFYKNMGTRDDKTVLKNTGEIDKRKISGHSSSPTTIDLDGKGARDFLIGAEDGYLYYRSNSLAK